MLRNKTANKPITPLYSTSSSTGLVAHTEIKIDSQYSSILTDNSLHAKTRIFWGVNLLLLMLSKNKPEEHLENSKTIYRIKFCLDVFLSPDFVKDLVKALGKHFLAYSSNSRVEAILEADGISLILLLPSKVVAEHWESCVKSVTTLSNPEYHKQFPLIALSILTVLEVKVETCITLELLPTLSDLHIECEFVYELMQILKRLLNTNLLDFEIAKAGIWVHEKIHSMKITLVASIVDTYFNIPDGVENKETIVKLIAACISKKAEFMDFLKYKIKQFYEDGKTTDRRIAVHVLDNYDLSRINTKIIQHGIFVMYDVDEGLTIKEFEGAFVTEVSHYDLTSRVQVIFANNTSLRRLDLHGFDVSNAIKLSRIFLDRHFNNFTSGSIIIDVGKASHSPNNISRLSPPIERLLPSYVTKGLIDGFDSYNQTTGHLVIKLTDNRYIKMPESIVEDANISFKPATKTLPGTIKIQLKSIIKDNLQFKLNEHKPIRVRIKFPKRIEDRDLLACLEKDVILQQVEELFPNTQVNIKISKGGDSFYIMISKPAFAPIIGKKQLSTNRVLL